MPGQAHRIAIGQIEAVRGDVQANVAAMTGMVREAQQRGAEMIAFPELSLTGYYIGKGFEDVAITLESEPMTQMRELAHDIDICFGFIEETPSALFYNSAVYLSEGRIRQLHRKVYLPTYGMFDERRYFGSGWNVGAFETDITRAAMLICGDAWHLPLPYLAAHDGADLLIIPSASSVEGLTDTTPSDRAWEMMCRSYALTLSCFVMFINFGGSDGNLTYWGGSLVAGPDGNLIAQSQTSGQDLVVADLDLGALRRQRIRLPFRRDDSLAYTLELGRRVMESKMHREPFYDEDVRPPSSMPPPKPR